MQDKKFYITTPIYYVTAKPHLGSLYSTVLADVAARWHKLMGYRTFLLTGTDEHGQKIAQAAEQAGMPVKQFVDQFIPAYKGMWDTYEIEYNHFIRTTDAGHVHAVQQWIEQMLKQGDIYKSFYEGWYCVPDETFVTVDESLNSSSHPSIHFADANQSGRAELTQPKPGDTGPACPTCSRPTVFVSEESYFFRLSKYQDALLKFYKENPTFILPKERAQEVIRFVEAGLKDLSISRTSISWGIPFPGDPKHVVYVWADALNNYLTAVGYPDASFKQWWPPDVQVLGKDIVRFHAVFWPAFLMATRVELPKHLLVHGWIKVGEHKMSKSLGNVVDPQLLFDRYGAEPVRYYLTRYMAITHDSSFSDADLEQKVSTDLANDLGNLLNRMLVLAQKFELSSVALVAQWSQPTQELQLSLKNTIELYRAHMREYQFHLALGELWKFIGHTNAYFHGQEPWKVAKQSEPCTHGELNCSAKDRCVSPKFIEIISATAHSLRAAALLLWPVLPKKMETLLNALGHQLNISTTDIIDQLETQPWNQTFMLKSIEPLFAKYEPAPAENAEPKKEVKEAENAITIQDFTKIELLVGTVKACEPVPKSDKLYRLEVDFGPHGKREILSGVRKDLAIEELLGKQGVFVFNLAPRPMMGFTSHGMMLFAKDSEGKTKPLTVATPVPDGSRVS